MAADPVKAPIVPTDLPPEIQILQPGVKLTLLVEHPDLATPTGLDVDAQGNLLHCIGAPRYQYAIVIAGQPDGPKTPRGLRFHGNIFAPGKAGVANHELK